MKSRKDIYAVIKEHNLEEYIKDCTGINYTNCSSEKLLSLIDDYLETVTTNLTKPCDSLTRLCEVLRNKRIIIKKEEDYILGKD